MNPICQLVEQNLRSTIGARLMVKEFSSSMPTYVLTLVIDASAIEVY